MDIDARAGVGKNDFVSNRCRSGYEYTDLLRRKLGIRTTDTNDDELDRWALEAADPEMDRADLLRKALKVYVRLQAVEKLAVQSGRAPHMKINPRRQPASKTRR